MVITMGDVKRFIAGAVCPKCGAMDRLVMYSADGKQFRECVSCDFHDEMHLGYVSKELDTRVNRSEEERAAQSRPVKILMP